MPKLWRGKLHQYHVFMLKCFCLGAGDHLSFPPAPDVKVPDVTAVVLQKEESGLAPGIELPGLKSEHHGWSGRDHKMWVICISLMCEVGDGPGLAEKTTWGDLVLGRRLCFCPLCKRDIKHTTVKPSGQEGGCRRE